MKSQNHLEATLFSDSLQFIYQKKYTQITEMTVKIYQYVIDAIQTLPVDEKYFQAIQNIIKFYGVQILIFFQKTYKTIQNDEELANKYQSQIKKIGRLVKNITYEKHIEQIRFFYFKGTDHKYKGKKAKNQLQLSFLDYIQKLSLKVQQLKEFAQNNQKEESNNKKEQLTNQILSMYIQRSKKLNQFQERFQNHIKAQAFKISQENNQQKNIKDKSQKNLKDKIQKNVKDKVNTPNQSISLSKSKEKHFQSQQQQQNDDQSYLQQKQKKSSTSPHNQIQKPQKKQLNQQMLSDLSQIPVCCRKFFFLNETIYQPQSLTIDYKYYNYPFKEESYYKIIKTICGLLNVQGGNIFIGIRSDRQTFKKEIFRYILLQSQKIQFSKKMEDLISKCILPAISYDMYKIQYVPIKKKQTNSFISGEYIIKIWVKYGNRKEVYSYKQFVDSKKQWFAFKTQNEVKNLDNIQKILQITRQRLLNTPPQPRPPFHQGPCPKPDFGKPLYENDDYVKKNNSQVSSEEQSKKPKIYIQKATKQFQNLLVVGLSQIELRRHLIKKCGLVISDFHLQPFQDKKVGLNIKEKDHFTLIKDSMKQLGNAIKLLVVSKTIKSSMKKQILDDLIDNAKINKINQIKCDKFGLITCQTIEDSLLFFITLSSMDQNAIFL